MGVIIFTRDASIFKKGKHVVMYKHIDCDLSDKDTTYILLGSLTSKEIKDWLPLVSGKLVVETNKNISIPKGLEDNIIIDKSLKPKPTNYRWVKALFSWTDRRRVHKLMKGVPIPLAMAFVKQNNNDIELYRRISKTYKHLSDDYSIAILTYSIKGENKQVKYPKKNKGETTVPSIFRSNDKHWEMLVRTDVNVANLIRGNESGSLPKGVKKRREKVTEWL